MYETPNIIVLDPKTKTPTNRIITEETRVLNERYISKDVVSHILKEMEEAKPILEKNIREASKRSGNF